MSTYLYGLVSNIKHDIVLREMGRI